MDGIDGIDRREVVRETRRELETIVERWAAGHPISPEDREDLPALLRLMHLVLNTAPPPPPPVTKTPTSPSSTATEPPSSPVASKEKPPVVLDAERMEALRALLVERSTGPRGEDLVGIVSRAMTCVGTPLRLTPDEISTLQDSLYAPLVAKVQEAFRRRPRTRAGLALSSEDVAALSDVFRLAWVFGLLDPDSREMRFAKNTLWGRDAAPLSLDRASETMVARALGFRPRKRFEEKARRRSGFARELRGVSEDW